MIVSMKKITVVTQAKDADDAVRALGALGVVHVAHQKNPQSKNINDIQDDCALLRRAWEILPCDKNATAGISAIPQDWKIRARHIIDLHKRIDQLQEFVRSLAHKIAQWEKWGDFDPAALQELRAKGIYVKLYQIPEKEIKRLAGEAIVKVFFVSAGLAHCAVVSRKEIEIGFKELELPTQSLAKMKARIVEDEKAIGVLQKELTDCQRSCPFLRRVLKEQEKELEFASVLGGMGEARTLAYLRGYVPFDAVGLLEENAKKEHWGLLVEDPGPDDSVPTLLRNPRWVSLINPVFKMLEIVPGYQELDISLWFLVFLSLFFGMLVGDAGYGLVGIITVFLVQQRIKKNIRTPAIFFLFYLFFSCSVAWGLLSGTLFGQQWLDRMGVQPLLPALRNDRNVQVICFFLGALHLSVAHLWRAILKFPSMAAFADLGWTAILWGVFFLANTLILGASLPWFTRWLFIPGIAAVILFTSPQRNLLKGVGAGLGALSLSLVNTFTDVVSYIRLFAVGLAGVAIADAFNAMALGIGFNTLVSGFFTVLILICGHLLNIILAPLSVVVHGVRLNVLEFCSHVDIKW
ncbi:MAG: hypothetical protein KKC84_05820, partial [Candidatus Omnitrophica bacterium]|nr:hypothetical protein [Candidatus Omnitrophota bacterium]